MKIYTIAFLIAVAINATPSNAGKHVRRLTPVGCSPTNLCGNCQFDCDFDEDCGVGLLCADEHQAELAAKGYDERKADCGPVGQDVDEVCFSADLIALDLCEFDCDLDSDCKSGLWCADEHKAELAAAGFDERKANCGDVGGQVEEVCFDPNILCDMDLVAEFSDCWDIEAEDGGTWSFKHAGSTVRFDFDDSKNCGGANEQSQEGIASTSFKVGCDGAKVDLSVAGIVEGHMANYDFLRVRVDGVLIYEASGKNWFTGCAMTAPQVRTDLTPYTVSTPGEHVLTLETDTNDGLYHVGAFYETDITFLPV